MAGKYIEIINPGYSTLFTRDLPYTPAVSPGPEASTLDPFDPDSAAPLYEGEWLETSSTGKKFTRTLQATGAVTAGAVNVAAATHSHSTVPCYMYFGERGRFDAQVTKKAHAVTGPQGFTFRTKMCVCANSVNRVGDKLYVAWIVLPSGHVVRGLITETDSDEEASGDWFAGVVQRVHGVNDITVQYQPGFKA